MSATSDSDHIYGWLVAPEVVPRGDGTRPTDDRSYISKQSTLPNSKAIRLNFLQFNSLSIARKFSDIDLELQMADSLHSPPDTREQ